MLREITDFFHDIFDLIVGLVKFVFSLFQDLIWLITHISDFASMIPSFFTPLPAAIVSVIGVAVSIIIILRVMGRDE